MPSQEPMLTSRQKPTDIYSLMLILASVFLLFTTVLIWQELDEFYDFWGTAEGVVAEDVEEEEEEGEETDADFMPHVEAPKEDSTEK